MNIEKLKELSRQRIINNPKYIDLKNKQEELIKIKNTISQLEDQIKELEERTSTGIDNFHLIDTIKLKKEELEKKLKTDMQRKFSVEPSDYFTDIEWILDLNESIDFMETMGISCLLVDSNYTSILREKSLEIGIPELSDDQFLKQLLQVTKTSKIDGDILADDIVSNEYYKPEIIEKYINRLITIAMISKEKYDQLNRQFLNIRNNYFSDRTQINLYDAICEVYDEKLGREFLVSLAHDEFYQHVNPNYTIACFLENPSALLENTDNEKKLKEPQIIYSDLIAAYNNNNDNKINIAIFSERDNEMVYENVIYSIHDTIQPNSSVDSNSNEGKSR